MFVSVYSNIDFKCKIYWAYNNGILKRFRISKDIYSLHLFQFNYIIEIHDYWCGKFQPKKNVTF